MKIGLVLSGGGARGIAHLGVIKALEELGIHISNISGASFGAIVGAFYADGYSPDDIFKLIIKTNLFKMVQPAINWQGLLTIEKSEVLFSPYLTAKTFEDLKIPLTVVATNVKKGKSKFFYSGELIKPMLASSCLPVIFKPVELDGKLYIDGGILNNLPVEPLIVNCDRIIGVHTNPIDAKNMPTNMKAVFERTMMMTINYNVYARKNKCDVFIEPKELCKFNVFDFKKAQEIFDIGYDHTIKYFSKKSKLKKELQLDEA
ncbi:MAG: patatin-like phospholipase family protein [Cyclobacteriaceae bacterium]